MWRSEWAGRETVLHSWVTRDKLSPLRLWSPLTKGCTSAWLELPFSSRTLFKQPAHQCSKSSVPMLLPVLGSLLGHGQVELSLQFWHCQGLFILLLLWVSPKAFHCPRPQALRDEDVSYIWYQYDNKKHEYFINESGIFSFCPPFFWKTHLHSLMQSQKDVHTCLGITCIQWTGHLHSI